MQTRTRKIFMALVGAYLVYMGVQLVNSAVKGNPQNKILFIICGVVFALFGAATIVFNIKEYIKAGKEEQEEAEVTDEGDNTEESLNAYTAERLDDIQDTENAEPENAGVQEEDLEEGK